MSILSKLVPTVATSFAVQSIFASVFVPQANDIYYDLGGSIGFLTSTFVSLYYPALKTKYLNGTPLPPLSSFAPRQLLLSAALSLWAVRTGTFLFTRALKSGGDSRFDEIKHKPGTFLFAWMMQATWVTLVGLPVFMVNVLPARLHPALGFRDYTALGLFMSSWVFEVTADYQKGAWRKARDSKQHDEKFITSGLWSLSRHPNYAGEVGLWTGIWALSTASLQTRYYFPGAVAAAAISPLFTYTLTRFVSGVPILEISGDKKFGGDPKWEHYKNTVPIFFPWGRK